MGFCSDRSYDVRTKFQVRIALLVFELIGGTQKCGQAHAPFSRIDPVNVPAKFEVRSFTRS